MTDPNRRFALFTFGGAVALAAGLWRWGPRLDPLLAWLAAITLVAFFAYGYDKLVAIRGRTRVPEKVLLTLACAGGTLGAFAGMRLFRHKTTKARFQRGFWLIVAAQVTLVALYVAWVTRPG